MLLSGMLEMRTRKQQLERVGKEQKDHFQLQCLMVVGSKVSMDDITPSWIFQRRKLEAVLFPFRHFWYLLLRWFQLYFFVPYKLLLPISLYCSRHLFFFTVFRQSAIYDNEIFHSLPSKFINSVLPPKVQLLLKNKVHRYFCSCFGTSHLPF